MGFSLISAAEVLFHAVQVILAVIIPRRRHTTRRLYDADSQVCVSEESTLQKFASKVSVSFAPLIALVAQK